MFSYDSQREGSTFGHGDATLYLDEDSAAPLA